jgi:hypothetical protein
VRRLTVALIFAVGCGNKSSSPVTPIPPATIAPWGQGKPLVTPGERMTYRLSLKGFELASYTLAVGDLTDLDGKQTIVVEGHAKSVGLANMVAKVDDRFTSWIDVETGKARRFQTAEYETGSDKNVEHAIVDFAKREGDTVPVSFQLNDTPATPEPQKVTQKDVWDYNAFLVALRAWEAPAGATITTEVFRSRFLWKIDVKVHGKTRKIDVKVHGKTRLVTELGELPALRFDGHAVKLARDGSKFPDTDERDFSIWISDEGDRVPLKNTAKTDYGDIEMVIVDYQPGTGQRLRPQN